MIKHENILYVRDISEIGGVESFVWEMVKKYHNLDIAVVYKQININQLRRLSKYCKCYRHFNERIECKVAIINYDTSIIDYIDKGDIYQVIHGDYANEAYHCKPPTDPRIKEYIAITKHIEESFKKLTGCQNVRLSYNPLTIEHEDYLTLVSATRLSKVKGKDRMQKLADALDREGVKYIWYIFTTDRDEIKNDNVIYMKPRLDVDKWIEKADYLIQLSDTEACSYSINEALYRNIPVIVTPLPYLDEIGVKDGKNAYILEFNCSNVNEIAKKINKKPIFEFTQLKDDYKNILQKSKRIIDKGKVSVYIKVGYTDMELERFINIGEVLDVKPSRADVLVKAGVAEYL